MERKYLARLAKRALKQGVTFRQLDLILFGIKSNGTRSLRLVKGR